MNVSVIIPTFNRAAFLRRSIGSVFAQTVSDWEIIVVDDASVDDTASVMKQIIKEHPDRAIRYIVLEHNSGAQTARNHGIREARGTWVGFLDSDDEWLPNRLEAGLTRASAEGVEVVHCDCYVQREGEHERQRLGVRPLSGLVYEELLKGPGPVFPGYLVKRSCFDTIGLLDETIKAYQEWDTGIRLAERYRFGFVSEPLFIWHLHAGEAISKDQRRNIEGFLQIVRKHRKAIERGIGVRWVRNHFANAGQRYRTIGDTERWNECFREEWEGFPPFLLWTVRWLIESAGVSPKLFIMQTYLQRFHRQ